MKSFMRSPFQGQGQHEVMCNDLPMPVFSVSHVILLLGKPIYCTMRFFSVRPLLLADACVWSGPEFAYLILAKFLRDGSQCNTH